MSQRAMDWVMAVVGSIVSFALSWPFWRDFEYWAESETMWIVYFVVGFGFAVYVFYVFIACLRTLFQHAGIEQSDAIKAARDRAGEP